MADRWGTATSGSRLVSLGGEHGVFRSPLVFHCSESDMSGFVARSTVVRGAVTDSVVAGAVEVSEQRGFDLVVHHSFIVCR